MSDRPKETPARLPQSAEFVDSRAGQERGPAPSAAETQPETVAYHPVLALELTPKMADLIRVFLEDPPKGRYGYELMELTGQSSSYVYPALAKFEQAGWLTSGKEAINPHVAGRPPRRVYRISGAAVAAATAQLEALSARYRPPRLARPRLVPRGGTL